MPDDQPTPALQTHAHEGAILSFLLEDANQRPWTVHELTLEIGDSLIVADSVSSLSRAGLVHRTSDGFIFASRAAVRGYEVRE